MESYMGLTSHQIIPLTVGGFICLTAVVFLVKSLIDHVKNSRKNKNKFEQNGGAAGIGEGTNSRSNLIGGGGGGGRLSSRRNREENKNQDGFYSQRSQGRGCQEFKHSPSVHQDHFVNNNNQSSQRMLQVEALPPSRSISSQAQSNPQNNFSFSQLPLPRIRGDGEEREVYKDDNDDNDKEEKKEYSFHNSDEDDKANDIEDIKLEGIQVENKQDQNNQKHQIKEQQHVQEVKQIEKQKQEEQSKANQQQVIPSDESDIQDLDDIGDEEQGEGGNARRPNTSKQT